MAFTDFLVLYCEACGKLQKRTLPLWKPPIYRPDSWCFMSCPSGPHARVCTNLDCPVSPPESRVVIGRPEDWEEARIRANTRVVDERRLHHFTPRYSPYLHPTVLPP